jgi:hypothetical protein
VENVRFAEMAVSGDVTAATVDGRPVPLIPLVTIPRQRSGAGRGERLEQDHDDSHGSD